MVLAANATIAIQPHATFAVLRMLLLPRRFHCRSWGAGYQWPVPATYRAADGYRLGQWVAVQRGVYTRGDLSPERVTRLEALDGWSWDLLAAQWEEGYAALRAYVDEQGTARVPDGHRTADGYGLGQWVRTQRGAYTGGDMDSERITRLEALDGWVWKVQ